jgi:hypothetical protein
MLYVIEKIPTGTVKLPEPLVYVVDPAGVFCLAIRVCMIPLMILFLR